jgi:hypothetical protein
MDSIISSFQSNAILIQLSLELFWTKWIMAFGSCNMGTVYLYIASICDRFILRVLSYTEPH